MHAQTMHTVTASAGSLHMTALLGDRGFFSKVRPCPPSAPLSQSALGSLGAPILARSPPRQAYQFVCTDTHPSLPRLSRTC